MQPPVRHIHFEMHLHLAAVTSSSDNVFGNDQAVTQISATAGAVATSYNTHIVMGLTVKSPTCRPGLMCRFGCKVCDNRRRT